MKLYVITIKPMGGLGTLLKGDTLFGHFCWQAAYDPSLLEGSLERQFSLYSERPFVVFSSAFPKVVDNSTYYACKRPDLPLSFIFPPTSTERAQRIREGKENKKKKWMLIEESLSLDLPRMQYLSDTELLEKAERQTPGETRRQLRKAGKSQFFISFSQPHNTINRATQTTGPEPFAPYTEKTFYYYPGTELAIFTLIDEKATDIERVYQALERIGQWGYGKDASIGLGRFELTGHQELLFPEARTANACYTLAPVVPRVNTFQDAYFVPFVRFGKHGDRLARSANPFKNPIIMADEGAVFIPRESAVFQKPYLGSAVIGVSKSESTIGQGYSIYLPLRLEV